MDKYDEILSYIDNIQYVLSQILSSGFKTCHEHTIKELKTLSSVGESYGFSYAADKLKLLNEELENKRHSFNLDFMNITAEYCKLNEYCLICKNQIQLLKAEESLKNEKSELIQ